MSIALPLARTNRSARTPGLPSPRRILGVVGMLLVAGLGSTILATLVYARTPAPTGSYGVGRAEALLVDASRSEAPDRGGGARALRLVAWYPADAGSGEQAPYMPGLDVIAGGLASSGEVPGPAIGALRFVGTSARTGATVAGTDARFPVVVLSPGNATNVAFYGSLAEELASRGFVVAGVDHPYQVAAVDVGDRVAIYREVPGTPAAAVAAKIDERVLDLTFVIDELMTGDGLPAALRGRVDLGRIAVVGHSNGGLAAAAMCADVRVDACVNIDGLSVGGPFSAREQPRAPDKPFLFLTKETMLHPALVELFEAGGEDTYRIVVPAATHAAFADGARFVPRLLPLESTADHVLTVERQVVGAFLQRHLVGGSGGVFDGLDAPTDVYVEVYPLNGRPTLPG